MSVTENEFPVKSSSAVKAVEKSVAPKASKTPSKATGATSAPKTASKTATKPTKPASTAVSEKKASVASASKKEVKPKEEKKPTPAKNGSKFAATDKEGKKTSGVPRTDVNRWSPIKVRLIEALKKGNAVDSHSSLLPDKIASLCKGGELTEAQVRHQLNPKYDLVTFGYVAACKLEGQKTSYYLTKKGQNKTF